MIKNIVFDVGRVLVDFNWQQVFHALGLEGEVYRKVEEATVRSAAWGEFDRGELTDEEVLQSFLAQAPECEQEIRTFWEHVPDTIKRYDYAEGWIQELKAKGYKVYLLSNYPDRTYRLTRKELSFVDMVDGGIFSYQIKCIKPEPAIYQALFEKYSLIPEECVFLDDNGDNIAAAKELGMHAIQFQDKEQAERELAELGVK